MAAAMGGGTASARAASIAQLEARQPSPPGLAPPAPDQSNFASTVVELRDPSDQGVLTDQEFAAAKQKLIDES
jgi:hypothetical protein